MTETLNQKIASFSIELLLEEPFYGHLLAGLVKQPGRVEEVVLAVWENQFSLCVNEEWLEAEVSLQQRRGRIKHELLHLVFRHPLQRGANLRSVFYHIATDLVVNQFLEGEELAPEAITLQSFEALGLAPGSSWEEYYQVMLEAWMRIKREEPQEDAGWVELVNRCLAGRHPAIRLHRYWPDEEILFPPTTRAVLEAQLTESLRRVRRRIGVEGMGKLPHAVQEALPKLESPSQVDWRQIVRLFATSSRKTRLKNTIRRPSKRYGTTPGIQVVRAGRFLVAVDTSASVPPAKLNAFFGEVHHLWRLGNELLIVECDTTIRRRYEYGGRRPAKARGRGGTQYDEPIRWANQFYRPDGILYFTDGQGPAPLEASRAPMLWVIAGEEATHLPGRRVVLDTRCIDRHTCTMKNVQKKLEI